MYPSVYPESFFQLLSSRIHLRTGLVSLPSIPVSSPRQPGNLPSSQPRASRHRPLVCSIYELAPVLATYSHPLSPLLTGSIFFALVFLVQLPEQEQSVASLRKGDFWVETLGAGGDRLGAGDHMPA